MLKELGFKEGVVTTGSSFDHTEMDDKMMEENGECDFLRRGSMHYLDTLGCILREAVTCMIWGRSGTSWTGVCGRTEPPCPAFMRRGSEMMRKRMKRLRLRHRP